MPVAAAPVADKIVKPEPAVIKTTSPVTIKAEPILTAAPLVPPLDPAPAATSPVPKGEAEMPTPIPTSTKAVAEKVKTMFTEMNDRAKAAMEKSTKVGEELTEFTKGNMEALVASAKTAAKGAETLGQEVAEYGKKSFETASAAMKSMATVKSPTELFQLQSEFAKSSFDGAISEASKLSEAWIKLAGDVFQPLSSRYALAAEKFKSAAL
jgi:phasin family protein